MKKQADKRIKSPLIRALGIAMAAVFVFGACILPICADPPQNREEAAEDINPAPEIVGAPYIYLYNFENDRVLFETDNLHDTVYPTSTVKIMTAITAIEALGDDRQKTISITDDMLEQQADNCNFKVGEVVSAEQMLYAMLVNSSNNAAIILANIAAGSKEEFVEMMNDKAFELGALGTVYTNPTGLHSDAMSTTPADTAAIAKYAYSNPYFMEIVSTQTYQMDATNMSGARKFHNTNWLMSKYYVDDYYYEYAMGMNAGSTVQGGYSSVTVARNPEGTLTYLCVIMKAEKLENEEDGSADYVNFSGAVKLLDWAMSSYGYIDILSTGTVVCEVPVGLSSTADYVTLVPSAPVSVFLPSNVDVEKDIRIINTAEENVKAPVTKGQVLGYAKVVYNGEEIGRTELIATSDIVRSEFLFALERISNFTKSRFFIATVISAAVLTVLYILIQARLSQKRLRSRVPRNYRR